MKAYTVTWQKLPTIEMLIAAKTASKARYLGYLLCWDAYRQARIIEMTVRRAPKFDGMPARYDGRVIIAEYDANEPARERRRKHA